MVDIPQVGYALLNTISGPESNGAYNIKYGGGRFDDYDDHPRDAVLIKSGPNKGKYSTAAGKYQFLSSTWDSYKKKLGLKDFSPSSQDQAAWQLAQDDYFSRTKRDLQTDLEAGDLSRVPSALHPTWTSMPGGIEQGIGSNAFVSAYNSSLNNPALSAIAGATSGPPLPRSSPTSSAGILAALNQTNPAGAPFGALQSSAGLSSMGSDLSLGSNPVNINSVPLPRRRPGTSVQSTLNALNGSADLSLAGNPVLGLGNTQDPNFGLGMAPDVGAYQMPGNFTGGSDNGAPSPAGLLQQQYARENAGQNPGQLNQPVQPNTPSAWLTAQRQGYPGATQLGVGDGVDQMYAGTIAPYPATKSPGLGAQQAINAQGGNATLQAALDRLAGRTQISASDLARGNMSQMGDGGQDNLVPNFGANGQLQSISPGNPTSFDAGDPLRTASLYQGILPLAGQQQLTGTQQPKTDYIGQILSGTVPPITPTAPAPTTPALAPPQPQQQQTVAQALGYAPVPATRSPVVQALTQPAVGSILGRAGNGGIMIQGRNGIANSITQNSDQWLKATGQGTGAHDGGGSSGATSLGGGSGLSPRERYLLMLAGK